MTGNANSGRPGYSIYGPLEVARARYRLLASLRRRYKRQRQAHFVHEVEGEMAAIRRECAIMQTGLKQ